MPSFPLPGAAPHRPDRGVIGLRYRTLNQDGKIVQDMTASLLMARRPAFAKPTAGKPSSDKATEGGLSLRRLRGKSRMNCGVA
jgi:hypothetical protein